jgi:hypothetical protein
LIACASNCHTRTSIPLVNPHVTIDNPVAEAEAVVCGDVVASDHYGVVKRYDLGRVDCNGVGLARLNL